MEVLLTSSGFLGTRAHLYADLTLIIILFSGMLFTVGWRLAVGKHFTAHRWVQTIAVSMNTIVVLIVMITSFIIFIFPGIPGKLLEGTYGVTTIHAIIGMFGLILGVFIALEANELGPSRFRLKNYKHIMRISYSLYMLATLVGVVVYIAVYAKGT